MIDRFEDETEGAVSFGEQYARVSVKGGQYVRMSDSSIEYEPAEGRTLMSNPRPGTDQDERAKARGRDEVKGGLAPAKDAGKRKCLSVGKLAIRALISRMCVAQSRKCGHIVRNLGCIASNGAPAGRA